MITKPELAEYRGYFEQYVNLVGEQEVLQLLEKQQQHLPALLSPLTEERAEQPYAEGKWTIKELLGHMVDTERVLGYRALCFSRNEQQPLPGFDENNYVASANFNQRTLPDLLAEYGVVRQATLALFRGMSPEMLARQGNANNNRLSVRALAYVIAGHELHHLHLLRTRYLV
jgi:hypothetical protein